MLPVNRKSKRQRSSLKVNLSFSSDLSDSANNSFNDIVNNHATGNATAELPLRQMSIVLERISADNATLSKNCQTLKDSILAKTKEIFDEHDELSLKTHQLLSKEHNYLDKSKGSSIGCAIQKNKLINSTLRTRRLSIKNNTSHSKNSISQKVQKQYQSNKSNSINKSDKVLHIDYSGVLQSSLNVNTSIDGPAESNKITCNYDCTNCKKGKCKKFDNGQNINSVALEELQESINLTGTSLQVHTSLDISGELKHHNYSEEVDVSNLHNKSTDSKQLEDKNSDDNQSRISVDTENDINIKCLRACPDKVKHKKQLLPLHESSELVSFSPVHNDCPFPQSNIFRKRHKNKKIKRNKKDNKAVKNSQCTKQSNEGKDNKDITEEKQKRKPRKIISKKIIIKKIVDEDILKRLGTNNKEDSQINADISASKRSSTNDFQSPKKLSIVQNPRKHTQRINIVITGYSNEDKNIIKGVVKALGSANIESHVTKRTTHVVTTGVRTINLLHGVIRGCWLVSIEWIFRSLESNMWINPVKYELAHFSKAVMENRKDRQLFGKSYIPELFAACGYIYIHGNTKPPCNVLKDLVKAAGGIITENQESAKILIGQNGLKETWILDCITSGELQPPNCYQPP